MMICLLLLLAAACQKNNNNSPYPRISLRLVSPDSLRSGNAADTSYFSFDFFDGDGDLNQFGSITLVDKRTNDSMFLQFPNVPDNVIDPAVGVSGTAFMYITGQDVLTRTDTLHFLHGDTTQFTLQVFDMAGHASNIITTGNFHILPH